MTVFGLQRTAIVPNVTLRDAAQQPWDAIVVGAGPAGALAARQLAGQGAAVLLVDKMSFPRWKLCGCCLNGAALAALASVGLGDLPQRLSARPLHRWRLCAAAGQAVCPLPAGVSLSRESFDTALVEEATGAGAAFLDRTQAMMADAGQHFCEVQLSRESQHAVARSRVLLAADGLAGRLLDNHPEFRPAIRPNSPLGAGTALVDGPNVYEDGTIFMACGRGGYVGLVRLEDGRIDIAAALDLSAARTCGGPAALAERILHEVRLPIPRGIRQAHWRGTAALTRRRARVAGQRIFVLGDAATYVEPFTGEGMAWAVTSAIAVAPLAAEGIDRWSAELATRWSKLHRRLVGARQPICQIVGRVLKHPGLAGAAVLVLAQAPWLAAPLIRAVNAPARLHCDTDQKGGVGVP